MKLNSWIAIACLAVLLLGAGCASRQPLKGTEVSGFDKKLSTFIYNNVVNHLVAMKISMIKVVMIFKNT